ncbi:delta(14)-sterol reductase [Cyberlindnera jadinii NRRL Y-1542]|uniref:Delta(14)-sterol reductase n=1 Tax=Cyberlindnera jadinii (strain ATCC 18201 / CBS 1600 / BCRC 20928 / JCM 3617 / NBRC 0987 / NRRL Y-1542) TaxID=983966 RepID=A0A1E4S3D1_CYBJN|nr:ERG4/ERG24 ergosterol biosynthesis protein [Cyberlindnera jadinii NRRL Y-1542]ODV74036.1 ERG4/ERG24 ergosterol biosynthesis protein [Cyberlindnera jadinii NRRL Y-1542]
MSLLNPRTKDLEFSGIPGVLAISLGLPTLCVVLHQLCNDHYHQRGLTIDLDELTNFHGLSFSEIAFNGQVWTYYLLWFFGLVLFDTIIPGTVKKGVTLRDGTSLSYNINGIQLSCLFVLALATRWQLTHGSMPELVFLYDNTLQFTVVAVIFSALLALFVQITSYLPLSGSNGKGTKERILAVGGNSGNWLYDWFIGRELNPRIGPWDIKLFCELRPGMLLWLLLNLASMHHQYLKYGQVYDSMLLVNLLQAFYIFDGVLNEEGCLTMMDITTDGFGFMLSFGDLALVPFTYSLQARYLAREPLTLGAHYIGFILGVAFVGFYIFKASNNQKNQFRQGKLPHLKSIQTERSTKLLCDGWWSLSQHINYFGDWLHATSWCLPTGFITPLTYYYICYFAGLLLHRQHRDELKCKEKYGKAWEEYEKKVPYKIIPYVY